MNNSTAKTASEILAEAENPAFGRVESAYILQRQDLQTRYDQLQAEVRAARRIGAETIGGNSELSAIETEIAEALIEYRFTSLSHREWADLLRKHPPTKKQIAEYQATRLGYPPDHNPDKFKPAALAAACIGVVQANELVTEGFDANYFERLAEARNISPVQFETLWMACWKANMGAALPKAVTAGLGQIPPVSEQSASSVTETDEGSLEASSLTE